MEEGWNDSNMSFESFTNQIPKNILEQVKVTECDEMAVFRPKVYIVDKELCAKDYHFVLPSSNPPPTRIGKKEYQFSKGKLLAFNPETVLLLKAEVPTKEYTDFTIKKDFFQQVAWEASGKRCISFGRMENVYNRGLISLIKSFEEEITCFKTACPLMVKSIVTQIVIKILRDTCSNSSLNENKAVPGKGYIKQALQYMEAYYDSNITIEDICSVVHLSSYHFIRMFKAHTGRTPHQHLMELRLMKAEEMLRKGEYRIDEVAELCGFLSKSHFTAQFKRLKGVAPSEYKRYT